MTNWCKQDCTARGRAEARWHEPRKICELLTLVNAGNLKACKLPPRQPSEAVKYQNETKNQNWEMQRSFSFYTDGLHHVIWFAIWGSCLLSILYVKSTALYTKFLQHISICATTAGGCQLPPTLPAAPAHPPTPRALLSKAYRQEEHILDLLPLSPFLHPHVHISTHLHIMHTFKNLFKLAKKFYRKWNTEQHWASSTFLLLWEAQG